MVSFCRRFLPAYLHVVQSLVRLAARASSVLWATSMILSPRPRSGNSAPRIDERGVQTGGRAWPDSSGTDRRKGRQRLGCTETAAFTARLHTDAVRCGVSHPRLGNKSQRAFASDNRFLLFAFEIPIAADNTTRELLWSP